MNLQLFVIFRGWRETAQFALWSLEFELGVAGKLHSMIRVLGLSGHNKRSIRSFAPRVVDCLLLLEHRAEEFQQAEGRSGTSDYSNAGAGYIYGEKCNCRPAETEMTDVRASAAPSHQAKYLKLRGRTTPYIYRSTIAGVYLESNEIPYFRERTHKTYYSAPEG